MLGSCCHQFEFAYGFCFVLDVKPSMYSIRQYYTRPWYAMQLRSRATGSSQCQGTAQLHGREMRGCHRGRTLSHLLRCGRGRTAKHRGALLLGRKHKATTRKQQPTRLPMLLVWLGMCFYGQITSRTGKTSKKTTQLNFGYDKDWLKQEKNHIPD